MDPPLQVVASGDIWALTALSEESASKILYSLSAFPRASKSDYTSRPNGVNNSCRQTFCLQSSWQQLDRGWSRAASPPPGGELYCFTLLFLGHNCGPFTPHHNHPRGS